MMPQVTELAEQAAITDVITALFVRTDERNWPGVLLCFAPHVHFDMTSVAGGEPSEIAGNAELEADAAVPQSVHV